MQGKREQFSGFNRTLDAINNVFRKFSAFHDETGRLNVDEIGRASCRERVCLVGVAVWGRQKWRRGYPRARRPAAYVQLVYKVSRVEVASSCGVSPYGEQLPSRVCQPEVCSFFLQQKTAYEVGLGIPAEPLFRSSGFNRTLDAINNVFRKFSAFHDETGRLNVDGMNIISNDGSNKLNRSRKARVSYKVQRTINASLNAATSTRAVSSNPNFVTRQKIEIIFG